MGQEGPRPPESRPGWLERVLSPDFRAAPRSAGRSGERPAWRPSAAELWVYGALGVAIGLTFLAVFVWIASDAPPGVQFDWGAKNRNLRVALVGLLSPVAAAWVGVRLLRGSRWAALVVLGMLGVYAAEFILLLRLPRS
jgi:hypothetical protein